MRIIVALIFFLTLSVYSFGDDFVIDEPNSGSHNSQPSPPTTRSPSYSSDRVIQSIGSVPTPFSLSRSKVFGEFAMYDSGGITARFVVGLFDIIDIGLSENLDGLIGSGDVNVNIPSAFLKVTILKNINNFSWGFGFDTFAYGKNGTYYSTNTNVKPATIYGFYTSCAWNYSVFGGNDIFTIGLRSPLLPSDFRDIANSSLYLGATISAPNTFILGLTLENLYLSMNRGDRILPSVIFTLLPVPQFKFNFIVQYEFYSQKVNRIVSLGYENNF